MPAAPQPPSPPLPAKTSGKAVASLIVGFFFFLLPCAIVSVVLGHISLSDIRKSAGQLQGRGIAIAGLVLGYVGLAIVPVILVIGAIAIPNLLRARMAANEASAVGSLRAINVAAAAYETTYKNGFPPSLDTLSGLGLGPNCDHAALIDGELASGQKNGYQFTYALEAASAKGQQSAPPAAPAPGCSALGGSGYAVTADPVTRGTTGLRSFYTDQTGVIRVERAGPATVDSPPLQ